MEINNKDESFTICQRCGKNVESHSNYCIYCGIKLSLADKPVPMNNDSESVMTQNPWGIAKKPDRTITVLIAGIWPLALTILLGLFVYVKYMDLTIKIPKPSLVVVLLPILFIWSLCYLVIFSWRWSKGNTLLESSLIALFFATLVTVALSFCFFILLAYLLRGLYV